MSSRLPTPEVEIADPPEPIPDYTLSNLPDHAEILSNPIGLPQEQAPGYLPQPGDEIPLPTLPEPAKAIGPWATGKTDWNPISGTTGICPVVDRYSITRYSTSNWRCRNEELLNRNMNVMSESVRIENDSKDTITRTYAISDKLQTDNSARLTSRFKDIDKWKETLERAIKAMMEEIALLEEERRRLKQAMAVLRVPEAIATECLDRRTIRPENELVRDEPEEELVREIALMREIRELLAKTLKEVEDQQVANRASKTRMEFDWSDKKEADKIEAINCHLSNKSRTILLKPGATRYPNEQSSEEYWEHFTRTTLEENECCRQRSMALRATLDAILLNTARDLKTQADTVEQALARRINCMDEARQRLENDLKACLRRLAQTELQIDRLEMSLRSMTYPMKVAQTRLDHRHQRRLRVENCRDRPQEGLLNEVAALQEGIAALEAQLKQSNDVKNELMVTRGDLEREIMMKRRAIQIDKDRCQVLRSHYPSATALSGYN